VSCHDRPVLARCRRASETQLDTTVEDVPRRRGELFEQQGDPLGAGARLGSEYKGAVVRQACGASAAGTLTVESSWFYLDGGTGRTARTFSHLAVPFC
jgi:hypothetical protein